MFYSWLSKKKTPLSVAFANFHGVNTLRGYSIFQCEVPELRVGRGSTKSAHAIQWKLTPAHHWRDSMIFFYFIDEVIEA